MLAQKIKISPYECNLVAHDKLWKDHINSEVSAAKLYPQRWGNTAQLYEDMLKEVHLLPKVEIDLPSRLQPTTITPPENYIKVTKATTFPKTTSGQIGWRSGKQNCNLEIYGPYAKPKKNIYKTFNWPLDAI